MTVMQYFDPSAYDTKTVSDNYPLPVRSMQKKWRDSFAGSAIDTSKWTVLGTGAGQSISVATGALTIAAGTTANATTTIITNEVFTVPFRLMVGFSLSQRIANQDFYIDAVSCDEKGVTNGLYLASWKLNGTTATQGIYEVKNAGGSVLSSSAVTILTTASLNILETELFSDECWFHSRAIDSTTGRSNSYVRHQQIPDPNSFYKLQLRVVNGGTAPASNTNFVVQYAVVNDYAELTAEITAGRGNIVGGQSMGAVITAALPTGSATIGGVNVITMPTPSVSTLNSAATTNATVVKASAGTAYAVSLSNTGASPVYLKLYNKATAPTVGTDIPILTIPVNAGAVETHQFGNLGLRFTTGIGFAITGAAADADTTAITSSAAKVVVSYV